MRFNQGISSVLVGITCFVSFMGSFPAHAIISGSFDACEAVFDPPSKTYSEYVDDARQKSDAKGIKPADFFDDAKARVAAKTWTGNPIPDLFEGALPRGISLIGHELFKANEPGLVKSNASEFVSLRATIRFEGQELGTNVGVNPQALLDNLSRPNKSLVSSNARAVLVFSHGGGTTTTGHHVAIQMANYLKKFGIDVISFDQLWHAEGPRAGFRDFEHYSEYMRQFIREYVSPAGVPIFFGGHSMGGLFADLYMRTHPNDDLIQGVVALSAVPDMAPGKSLLEKLEAQSLLDSTPPELIDRLAESDNGAGNSLLGQGKITPLAEFYEGDFTTRNDWSVPAHGGRDYVPALFVWGDGDWLYVGKERLIDQYIGGLSNVQLNIYGKRMTVTGIAQADKTKSEPQAEKVGHLIFDHYPATVTTVEAAKTSNLEAYQDVRDFISRVLGTELKRDDSKTAPGTRAQNELFIRNFLSTYINNLAFREFMDQSKVLEFDAPPALRPIQALAYRGLTTTAQIKNPKKVQEIPRLEAELAQIKEEVFKATGISDLKEVVDRFQGDWVPAGPKGDAGRALLARKNAFQERNAQLDRQLKDLRKVYDVSRKNAQVAATQFRKVMASEFAKHDPAATKAANEKVNLVFEKLQASHQKVSEAITNYRIELYRTGQTLPQEVPLPIRSLIHEYRLALEAYQKTEAELNDAQMNDIRAGRAGTELQAALHEMERTSDIAEKEKKQVEALEVEQQYGWNQAREITRTLLQMYDNHFLSARMVTGRQLLSRAWNDFDADTMSLLNQLWTRWKTIYKDRPEETGSVSLY